jgi:hypothetical protein
MDLQLNAPTVPKSGIRMGYATVMLVLLLNMHAVSRSGAKMGYATVMLVLLLNTWTALGCGYCMDVCIAPTDLPLSGVTAAKSGGWTV